jgi:hypothetical protein
MSLTVLTHLTLDIESRTLTLGQPTALTRYGKLALLSMRGDTASVCIDA